MSNTHCCYTRSTIVHLMWTSAALLLLPCITIQPNRINFFTYLRAHGKPWCSTTGAERVKGGKVFLIKWMRSVTSSPFNKVKHTDQLIHINAIKAFSIVQGYVCTRVSMLQST